MRAIRDQKFELRPDTRGIHFDLEGLRAHVDFIAARRQYGIEVALGAAISGECRLRTAFRQRT